jgi:hypothetical protein
VFPPSTGATLADGRPICHRIFHRSAGSELILGDKSGFGFFVVSFFAFFEVADDVAEFSGDFADMARAKQ